jgi:hypothetical protein
MINGVEAQRIAIHIGGYIVRMPHYGEYRVRLREHTPEQAYHTNCLQDAIDTLHDMRRRESAQEFQTRD